jgi:hypothetical protein
MAKVRREKTVDWKVDGSRSASAREVAPKNKEGAAKHPSRADWLTS